SIALRACSRSVHKLAAVGIPDTYTVVTGSREQQAPTGSLTPREIDRGGAGGAQTAVFPSQDPDLRSSAVIPDHDLTVGPDTGYVARRGEQEAAIRMPGPGDGIGPETGVDLADLGEGG